MVSRTLFLSFFLSFLLADPGVAQSATTYVLSISPPTSPILTCGSAQFRFTGISPPFSSSQPVPLMVTVQSSDQSYTNQLSQAQLGEGSWLWSPVNVLPGQYVITMTTINDQQYFIEGVSTPFTVQPGQTTCLNPTGASVSSQPSSTPIVPSHPLTSPPTTPIQKTSSSSSTHSSSSSSMAGTPSTISTISHTSAGVKAGVSVAVIAIVLSAAGALYWFLTTRRRNMRRPQNNLGGFGPGYNDLDSRDDYPFDSKPLNDPLGRSLSGDVPQGRMVDSYSHSDIIEEKHAQSGSAIGRASSNGATAGHSGSFSHLSPAVPPLVMQDNTTHTVALVGRSASGSSTSHEGGSPLESNDFETTTQSSIGVQVPRRAARKPVPAYGEMSSDRKNRASSNSMIVPSYSSSTNDLPSTGQSTLNHKASFGEVKPMNHVLMPDMPLTQN